MADVTIGHRLSFGEVSCRIHCTEQNVAVIWRKIVAPSLHLLPQLKCEPTIRGWQSITDSLADAEELGAVAYGALAVTQTKLSKAELLSKKRASAKRVRR